MKNQADALDIVQDSVVKIINKIDSLQFPEYFTTWDVRIIIFTALDY
ncbi:DNA-directed RNA polymerase specialized sigma24 family protein [Enterococcus sp. PF1-24]|nr:MULTISPECIES: sigma factor [unclassified Enterococcus]MDH6365649.1 DNA-directed RNA polymerase specialized sigma24 family protein [Enterococcus sp. PFB1-1]MDH6402750.1 DNA-directed RNA polymerase specialized sigma24 family protein [Enterococcus sp. PF1-24]